MNGRDMLQEAKKRFIAEMESRDSGWGDFNDDVVVSVPLSSNEAIGNPNRGDFSLLRERKC